MASGRVYSTTGKRGTTWHLRMDLGCDPTTGKPRQPSESFKSEKDAKKRLREWLREIDLGIIIAPKKMTLAQLMDEWLTLDAPTRAQDTSLAGYSDTIRLHITPRLGTLRINDITPKLLQHWYGDLLIAGVGTRTINLCRRRLNQAFAYAVRMNYLANNPVTGTRPPRDTPAPLKVWTVAETRRFLAVAEQDHLWPLWLLAILTGLRRGELLGLRWQDIDWEGGSANIVQSVVMLHNRAHIHGTKTGAAHRVALDGECLAALRAHRLTLLDRRRKCGTSWEEHDLIFCNGTGRPIGPHNLYTYFVNMTAKAQVSRIKFHGMRSTSATLMLGLGVHPKIASDRLGHATIQQTIDTYSYVDASLQRDAAEALRKAVRG
jgi:integrase